MKWRAEAEKRVRSGKYDMMVLNFANPDMVGHTGVLDAAVKAIDTVDACVHGVIDAILEGGRGGPHYGRPRQCGNHDRPADKGAFYGTFYQQGAFDTCKRTLQGGFIEKRRYFGRYCANNAGDDGDGKACGNDGKFPAYKVI